jgi:hypothetical protein
LIDPDIASVALVNVTEIGIVCPATAIVPFHVPDGLTSACAANARAPIGVATNPAVSMATIASGRSVERITAASIQWMVANAGAIVDREETVALQKLSNR